MSKKIPSPVEGWSDARFHSWILNIIRKGTVFFPNRINAINLAKVGRRKNSKTNRLAEHYKCALCQDQFPLKDIEVDHVEPVIPISGWKSWDDTIRRVFCRPSGWQVLCKQCHIKKSAEENLQRPKKIKRTKNV